MIGGRAEGRGEETDDQTDYEPRCYLDMYEVRHGPLMQSVYSSSSGYRLLACFFNTVIPARRHHHILILVIGTFCNANIRNL